VRYLLALLLIAGELSGQQPVMPQLPEPALYIDTSGVYIKKVDKSAPWIEEILPPDTYERWWMEMAQCQGFHTSWEQYAQWRFFLVNSEAFGARNWFTVGFIGYTVGNGRSIFLARGWRDDKSLLQHEFIHALQYENGEPVGHSPNRFRVCGQDYGL
jgi:hypothetical protein